MNSRDSLQALMAIAMAHSTSDRPKDEPEVFKLTNQLQHNLLDKYTSYSPSDNKQRTNRTPKKKKRK